MSPREVCAAIQLAQREAAEIMLGASKEIAARDKTDRRDLVTVYDGQVQELLIRRLSEALPEARFFCEENDRQDDLMAEQLFIIDPIDGTMNFVRGFNHSCISAAFMRNGTVCAAAVYNPYVNELFSAVLGEGARLNGRLIHVADTPLSESVVCVGTSPYDTSLADRTFALIKAAYLEGLDIRRQGSAELDLCSVAAGRAGLYFELGLSLWDYAAGMLIVQEAGGVALTMEGKALPLGPEKSPLIAGGRQALEEFLALAKEIP